MLALYVRLIGAQIRAQMQYKLSFWMSLLGFLAVTALEFTTIAILLSRFHTVGGWTIEQIALLYGLASVMLGLAEMATRGFDSPFERMMQQGTFDTLLIRPLNSFFSVLASEFQLMRLGRIMQGALVLSYAFASLPIGWTLDKMLLLPVAVVSGAAIYGGLIVISATVCFWTIKTPEVVNIFIYGGDETIRFPLSIYNGAIRAMFLGIVPIAFANYPTALYLLGRTDPHGLPNWIAWLAPLVALLFCTIAYRVWRFGVSKYQSSGS